MEDIISLNLHVPNLTSNKANIIELEVEINNHE